MPLTFFLVQRVVTGTLAGMTYTAGTGDNFNWRQAADTTGTLEVTAGGARMHLGGALLSQNTLYSLTVPTSSNASIYRDGTVVSRGYSGKRRGRTRRWWWSFRIPTQRRWRAIRRL
jgi:hypothetical protein